MATRATPISPEEEIARDAIGQSREAGRSIPSPTMVMFTGETQMMVEELAETLGISPQEVVGIALQQFHQRLNAEDHHEARAEEPHDPDTKSGGGDPFSAY
jgi:hypothetical protein